MEKTPRHIIDYIVNEEVFQYLGNNGRLIIGASTSGYTLNYSADKVNWSAWPEATPANEVLVAANVPTGTWLKLVGNTTKVCIKY